MNIHWIPGALLAAAALFGTGAATAGLLDAVTSRFSEAALGAAAEAVKDRLSSSKLGSAAAVAASGNSQKACPQFFPPGTGELIAKLEPRWRATVLCSSSFAVVHSGLTKTPLIAVERLNAEILALAKGEQRTEEFYPDDRLARGQRSELSDFVGSALDRGHLASAADAPTARAMHESFALSNMVPQDPTHNRKVWSKVEASTRSYVRWASGDVYVLTGPMFRGQVRTVGSGRVWVPTHLFKVVYDATTRRSWVYVQPNSSSAQMGPPISYERFVAEGGMDLLEGVERSTNGGQQIGRL